MSNIFRQAFLNSSWWWNSFSGWGISRSPSIPSWERFVWHSPMPINVSVPNPAPNISLPAVETTSLRAWGDYQRNGFVNRAETTERMADSFHQIPNITSEQVTVLSKVSTDLYLEELEKARKNPNGFSFLDVPLPEWTEWKDLKIQITWNGWLDAKNWTADLYYHW